VAGHCRRPILDLEPAQRERLRDILAAGTGSPGQAR
jgi:hypothetical protein